MTPPGEELVTARLLRFPVDVWARSSEHFEGLRREFALMALDRAPGVPARLLELVRTLADEYEETTSEPARIRNAAHQRGDREIPELVYRVPGRAAPAVLRLARMLDEADEFCRRGEHLLTLVTPPEALAFRRWSLGELYAQLGGAEPLAWPEADHEHLATSPRLRGEV